MQPFSLTKWYADCVSSEGETFVGHAAELSLGPVHVRYTGCLTGFGGGDAPRMRSTLFRAALPRIAGDACNWRDDALGFRGTWVSRSRTIQRRLYRSPEGSVNWNCIMPAADAEVANGPARRITGPGYLERLNLTIPPWKLPVLTVVWGRFAANGTSLVWLAWDSQTGEHECTAFVDSVEVACSQLAAESIETDCGTLELGNPNLLYDRKLYQSIADVLPSVQTFAPASFFELRDRKWVTPAVLHLPGKPDLAGWAVHSHFTWPGM